MVNGKVIVGIVISVLIIVGVYFFVSVGNIQESGNTVKVMGSGGSVRENPYLIEITSDYTIATFPLKIKLPESVLTEYISLFNDDARGERAWYNDFELKDGYATFTISNARGEYHLVFAHKNPEQLTIDDITW